MIHNEHDTTGIYTGDLSTGCCGAIVVAEAWTVDDPALTRQCLVMKLIDFTMQQYQEAAAVLIFMPSNISAISQDVTEVGYNPGGLGYNY